MNPQSRTPILAILTIVATVLAVAGCRSDASPNALTTKPSSTARKIPVTAEPVARRAVRYTVETVGSIEADEVIRVPARVAGVIEDISFREGTDVRPGTVLARVDPERYQLAHARAEANLTEAKAQLAEAEAALEKRRRLRDKDPGWVSEEEISNFSARVDQSRAGVAASSAALALAGKDRDDSTIRANLAGVIDAKLVASGQFVTAGTTIANVIDTRRLKLVFRVAESESVRLGDDPEIRFRVRPIPAREFRAKLYHVGQSADENTRTVLCYAWIDTSTSVARSTNRANGAPSASPSDDSAGEPGPDFHLRPGFFCDVSVVVETRDALVVPTSAALPTEFGFVAWVLVGEDRVERRLLKLGMYTRDNSVEVLDGLREGDRVVVQGGTALREGVAVQLVAATKVEGDH